MAIKKIESIEQCKTIKELESFMMEQYDYKNLRELYSQHTKSELEELLDKVSMIDSKAIDFQSNFAEKTTYMSENYDSFGENYENFKKCFTDFLKKNPIYRSLKSIDVEFLEYGDIVGLLGYKGIAIVMYSFDNEILIEYNKEVKIVPKSQIRPFDNFFGKTNNQQISFIYLEIEKTIKFKRSFSVVDYFSLFCSYFNVESKDLYDVLNVEAKDALVRELSKNQPFFKNKQIHDF